jgi:hypothetical protein
MSHGFRFFSKDRVDGEYQKFRPHEVTVLPPDWAANTITAFSEETKMSDKLVKDMTAAIASLLKITDGEAKALVETGMKQAGGSAADGEQAAQKDAEGEAVDTGSEVVTQSTQEAEGSEQEAQEASEDENEVGDDEMAVALVDALTELQEERSLREELAKQVGELKTELDSVKQSADALKSDFESRVKALEESEAVKAALLPKAVKEALSKRAANSGDTVSQKDVVKDVNDRQDAIKSDPGVDNTPIGYMMRHMQAASKRG